MSDQPPPSLDLIPARMLNEFAYCPRLSYLEWIQGEFAESADTLDGTFKHRRVDKRGGALPGAKAGRRAGGAGKEKSGDGEADVPEERIHARSVHLSAPRIGLTAIIDLVEGDGITDAPAVAAPGITEQPGQRAREPSLFDAAEPAAAEPGGAGQPAIPGVPAAAEVPASGEVLRVTPVDYKRGKIPDNPERSWEPERVQLCAACLILRENGYICETGVLYYVESRTRVLVRFDETLCARTLELLGQMRAMAAGAQMPPPLVDSPKCPRCSLVGICLPDETRFLAVATKPGNAPTAADEPLRAIIPTRDYRLPLYVQEQRSYVGKKGATLQITAAGEERKLLAEVRIGDTSQVSLMGAVQISTQALQALCEEEVPIAYFSMGGWFYGMTRGLGSKNVELRMRQFAAAADGKTPLALARIWVASKIENQRTLLRRNHIDPPARVLEDMTTGVEQAHKAGSLESLLGVEGNAARLYFGEFNGMLRPRDTQAGPFALDFNNRNRRPPVDPVNALLSYGYALLTKDLTVTAAIVGLDPYLGFFHQPKYGKPALALDLMEEFRALIVDSTVITAINTGVVGSSDFIRRGDAVALQPEARKNFTRAYERRMDSTVTHPLFGYRITYRRVLEVQARILSRVLLQELPEYVPFNTR